MLSASISLSATDIWVSPSGSDSGDGSKNSPVTGQPFGAHIEYYFEDKPLGSAGALFKIKDKLTEDFLLLNADVMFDVDFNRFVEYHKQNGGIVTLFTHPNSHPYDSGLIIADKTGVVEKWLSKEDARPQYYRNRVNAGLHVINPKMMKDCEIDAETIGKIGMDGKPIKVDLDRQLLKPLAGTGKMFCYSTETVAGKAEHLPRKGERAVVIVIQASEVMGFGTSL